MSELKEIEKLASGIESLDHISYGDQFRNVVAIPAGNPQNIADSELERIEDLFQN